MALTVRFGLCVRLNHSTRLISTIEADYKTLSRNSYPRQKELAGININFESTISSGGYGGAQREGAFGHLPFVFI